MSEELKRSEAEGLASKAFDSLFSISSHDWTKLRLFINWLYNEGYRVAHYPGKKIKR